MYTNKKREILEIMQDSGRLKILWAQSKKDHKSKTTYKFSFKTEENKLQMMPGNAQNYGSNKNGTRTL